MPELLTTREVAAALNVKRQWATKLLQQINEGPAQRRGRILLWEPGCVDRIRNRERKPVGRRKLGYYKQRMIEAEALLRECAGQLDNDELCDRVEAFLCPR
jgi:hypothetical protein